MLAVQVKELKYECQSHFNELEGFKHTAAQLFTIVLTTTHVALADGA